MLEKIQKPNDIKKIPADQLPALAEEIREFIIESLSKTGGHLASNLGVVELTIAMHRVFDLPKDKLIWDVGHQSYTHKILTGRKDGFETLRREGGISGFPKRSESDCDVFDTGHSSTSISAGVGYVRARELKKENYSKGVVVRQNEGKLELDLYIIVSHGVKISEVVHEVQKKVKYMLEKSLELDFNVINVFVQGVKVMK